MIPHLIKLSAVILVSIVSIGLIRGDIISYVLYGFNASHWQIGVLLLPLALTATALSLMGSLINKILIKGFGFNTYRMFASIGTPLHELSHAFFAVLFLHKIEKIVFFDINPETRRLGYVIHSYNPGSLYQTAGNFFIGISPILAGVAVLTAFIWTSGDNVDFLNAGNGMMLLLGGGHFWDWILTILVQTIPPLLKESNLQNPFFFAYLILLIGAGAHLSPSWSDIRGSLTGLVAFYGLMVIVNMLFLNLNPLLVGSIYIFDVGFTFFAQAVAVQIVVVVCLLLLAGLKKAI